MAYIGKFELSGSAARSFLTFRALYRRTSRVKHHGGPSLFPRRLMWLIFDMSCSSCVLSSLLWAMACRVSVSISTSAAMSLTDSPSKDHPNGWEQGDVVTYTVWAPKGTTFVQGMNVS